MSNDFTEEQMEQLLSFLNSVGVPEYAQPECGYRMIAEAQRWITNRTIKDFSHEYIVAIRRLSMEEGGGYAATIPQLGRMTFCSTGETPEEALNSLQELYLWLEEDFKNDEQIKFPPPMDEDCITFNEIEKATPEETHDKFRGYLLEAHRRNLSGETRGD